MYKNKNKIVYFEKNRKILFLKNKSPPASTISIHQNEKTNKNIPKEEYILWNPIILLSIKIIPNKLFELVKSFSLRPYSWTNEDRDGTPS